MTNDNIVVIDLLIKQMSIKTSENDFADALSPQKTKPLFHSFILLVLAALSPLQPLLICSPRGKSKLFQFQLVLNPLSTCYKKRESCIVYELKQNFRIFLYTKQHNSLYLVKIMKI